MAKIGLFSGEALNLTFVSVFLTFVEFSPQVCIDNMRVIIVFISFLAAFQLAYGQAGYQIRWIDDSRGLPQNSVKAIARDKDDFTWLITENGLVRYDGQDFKLFNASNISGIRSNRMAYLKGSKDSLLVYTDAMESISITESIPRKYSDTSLLVRDPAYVIHDTGRPWLNFRDNTAIYHQVHLSDGSYYMVSRDSIALYDSMHKYQGFIPYDSKTYRQFFTEDNELYLVGQNGKCLKIARLSAKSYELGAAWLPGLTVYRNAVMQQTFFYSGENLYYVTKDKSGLQSTLILEDFDFSHQSINSLYYHTGSNTLYLGSSTKGLCIIKPAVFRSVLSTSSSDQVYYAQAAYGYDKTLTANGIILSKNGQSGMLDFGPINMRHNSADNFSILMSKTGDIWVKKHYALYRLKASTGFDAFDNWEFDQRVTNVYEGTDGKIWFSTQRSGKGWLYYMELSSGRYTPKLFANFDFGITYIQQSGDRTFWLGTNAGLYKFLLPEKTLTRIEGIDSAHVRSIYIPNDKEIWVTTYGKGFFLYDNDKVIRFPLDKNRYLAHSHCIVEDNHGYFWITTSKGLFQVARQELFQYAADKTNPVSYYYYDKSSGFLTNEFNGGCQPCGVKLPDGELAFPSLNGMVFFNPGDVTTDVPGNGIYINEEKVDGETRAVQQTLELGQGFSNVTFFVTSPYYGHPYNLVMEFRLDGPVKQDWSPVENKRVAFTALPPGEYSLTFRKTGNVPAGYQYKELRIIVSPVFWQTLWFKICSGILLVLLFYYGFKARTRYIYRKNILLEKKVLESSVQLRNTISMLRTAMDDQKKQMQHHQKLIRSVTHDIKGPLKYMALTGKDLYVRIDNQDGEFREDIVSMYTSSFQLYHFVDNLLEFTKAYSNEGEINPEQVSLWDMVEERSAMFRHIASLNKTKIINKIPINATIKTNKQLLAIIIHNLLDNAVKNTYGGTITFTLSEKDEQVCIALEDTGRGMKAEYVNYYEALIENLDLAESPPEKTGIGLRMVIELLVMLHGDIKINSAEGKGTTMTLVFNRAT